MGAKYVFYASPRKKPEEIAEIVFEAIKENIFYILSHPAWDDTLRSH